MKKSDIYKISSEFLKREKEKLSQKVYLYYEMTVGLFEDYLASYTDLGGLEGAEGRPVIKKSIKNLDSGHFWEFLSLFVIRKVLNTSYETSQYYPRVLDRFAQFLFDNGYIKVNVYQEIKEKVAPLKKDLPRVIKLGEFLWDFVEGWRPSFNLYLKDPKLWKKKEDEVWKKRPSYKKMTEPGYTKITKISGSHLFGQDFDGKKIGPVKVNPEVATLVKIGDVINFICLGKFKTEWHILELGFVYPKGSIVGT